ncbi:unnamed protein product [Camellia sinensis]
MNPTLSRSEAGATHTRKGKRNHNGDKALPKDRFVFERVRSCSLPPTYATTIRFVDLFASLLRLNIDAYCGTNRRCEAVSDVVAAGIHESPSNSLVVCPRKNVRVW